MVHSKKLKLDNLEIKSFVTTVSTDIIRGGNRESDLPMYCKGDNESDDINCTVDSCLFSAVCH